MQAELASVTQANHVLAASPGGGQKRGQGSIFKELQFIRLTGQWVESSRDAGLWGGDSFDNKIFRQFQVAAAPQATIDFWFRGFCITPSSGRAFSETLRFPRALAYDDLVNLAEVLGVVGEGLRARPGRESVTCVRWAETGLLKGRAVLAVRWEHRKLNRTFSSLFIDADGDGRTVHEIHFSAPAHKFEALVGLAHEAFRSIQWRDADLPPMSASA